jgi:transcriptional regulator with PAS, ATPase and Fis domain
LRWAYQLSDEQTAEKDQAFGAEPVDTANDGAQTLKDMERQAIVDALAAEEGNRKRAAKRLGIALKDPSVQDKGLRAKVSSLGWAGVSR